MQIALKAQRSKARPKIKVIWQTSSNACAHAKSQMRQWRSVIARRSPRTWQTYRTARSGGARWGPQRGDDSEMLIGKGSDERTLSESETRELMSRALAEMRLEDKRVLVIIPDRTRTAPIPLMFRLLHELLQERVGQLDYLIALGT